MNAKLILGLFAGCSMAAAMTGCSSDEPGVQDNKAEKTVYLRVAISDINTASRVENSDEFFQDGTDKENAIGALQFKFYDASGNEVYASSATDYTFKDATQDQGSPSVGKIQEAVVQVALQQGQNLPSYVLCFANPVDWSSVEGYSKMSDYRNIERTAYLGADGDFAMNNAVYYGTDPISGQNNVKITGAPITAGQFFTSEEEANAATGGQVVDIYIERNAARVDFKIADAIEDYTIGDYTLSFVPSAWTVTADAPSMYAIKRFATTAGTEAPIPTMAEVQNYLTTWTAWNDAPLHRSYWACSPGFYATEFPRVSDNIIDAAANGTGAGEVVAPYALKYYSFNQVNGTNGSAIEANNTAVTRYALENTMGKEAFASLNPNAAAPSVLLTGKYTVNYNGAALPENTSFAIWNNQLYFIGSAVPAGAAADAQTILAAMLDRQQIVATNSDGALLKTANNNIEVAHPSEAVRTGNAIAEEFVTLQITTLPAPNSLYFKPLGSDVWKSIETEEELVYVNQQLAGQVNYAKAYTTGAAYFGIPIKHLRATEDTTNSPFAADGTVADWTNVRVGDFGLVRNHVYTINVTGIEGLGNGINDLDYPIVTPMDTYNYYIKYSIKVLNWRIVPAQNVIL